MNRRNAMKIMAVSSAVTAELLISGKPVHGYYFFIDITLATMYSGIVVVVDGIIIGDDGYGNG